MFQNLRIGTKLAILIGVIVAVGVGSSLYGLSQMAKIGNELTAIGEEDLPLTKSVVEIDTNQLEQAIQLEKALRIVQSHDEAHYLDAKEAFMEKSDLIDEELNSVNAKLTEILHHQLSDSTRSEFEHLQNSLLDIKEKREIFDVHAQEVFAVIESGNDDNLEETVSDLELQSEEINEELASITLKLEGFTQDAMNVAEKEEAAAIFGMITTSVIIGIVGGLTVIFARRMIAPLRKLTQNANTMATGDLTVQIIESRSKDEVGMLNNAFGKMSLNLRNLINEVQSSASQVSSTSEQLSASSEEVSSSIEQITQAVQQVANGAQNQSITLGESRKMVEDLAMAMKSLSDQSSNSVQETEQVKKSAEQGCNSANMASKKMNEILDSTNHAVVKIKLLSERTNKITTVLETIRQIADQTNLLALNAAIEAARAGDAGRGFAVVADEVRRLAVSASKSSEDIEVELKKIQEETQITASSIEETQNALTEGKQVIETALNSLDDIGTKIKGITKTVNSVADTAKEEVIKAEKISANTVNLASVAEENASATEETSAATEEQTAAMTEIATAATNLTTLAQNLQSVVTQFKTSQNQNSSEHEDLTQTTEKPLEIKNSLLKLVKRK